jgi:tetratricopeptide (TPR) repeat protein
VIALAIEELYPDRLTEQYEMLAYHFARAEDWERALEYLLKAADKSARAYANREAVALLDQALEAAQHLGDAVSTETRMAIHESRGGLFFMLSDFARSHAEAGQLLALARRAGDAVKEASALAAMGFASLWKHDFDLALAESGKAIDAGERMDAKAVLAAGHLTTGFVRAVTGRLDEAQQEFDRTLAFSRAAGDKVREAFGLGMSAMLRNWEGEYADARRLAASGMQVARESGVAIPLYWSFFTNVVVLGGKGDYEDALAAGYEGLRLCEKVGDEVMYQRDLNTLAWVWSELGDLTRAVEYNRRCAEGARKRGDSETVANAEINLADVALAQGDLPLAQEILDGVHRMVNDPSTSEWMRWRYSMHLFASLADLCIARGDDGTAARWADECLEIATRTRARKNLVKGWRARGEIATRQRRWDDAEQALRETLTLALALNNPGQLWRTHAALAHLAEARGRPDDARAAYAAALAVVDRMRAGLTTPETRAVLDRADFVRRLADGARAAQ